MSSSSSSSLASSDDERRAAILATLTTQFTSQTTSASPEPPQTSTCVTIANIRKFTKANAATNNPAFLHEVILKKINVAHKRNRDIYLILTFEQDGATLSTSLFDNFPIILGELQIEDYHNGVESIQMQNMASVHQAVEVQMLHHQVMDKLFNISVEVAIRANGTFYNLKSATLSTTTA
jgi:hypothetical protein